MQQKINQLTLTVDIKSKMATKFKMAPISRKMHIDQNTKIYVGAINFIIECLIYSEK